MKNIIISGWGRAGKTTLARKINEELGHFVINIDKLIAAFHGAYPQLDIRFGVNPIDTLAPFLGHLLGVFTSGDGVVNSLHLKAHHVKGNRFVIEGGHFNFEEILPILKTYGIEELKDRFILIGLVQNRKTADDFYNDLRKYDTEDDWTYDFSEVDLRDFSRELFDQNEYMTEYLTKHGFTLYDTSTEREKVFDEIIEDIKEELG